MDKSDQDRTRSVRLPARRSLQLFEAVTAMVFGHVLDRDKRDVRLEQLRNQCLEQARASQQFEQFATALDDEAIEILRSTLEECRHVWPPAGDELYQQVCEQAAIISRDGPNLKAAEEALHEAAFAGHIQLHGRLKRLNVSSDSHYRLIDHLYFSRRRGLYWRLNKIRKSNNRLINSYPGRNIYSGQVKIASVCDLPEDEFDDVFVERASFEAWLRKDGYAVMIGDNELQVVSAYSEQLPAPTSVSLRDARRAEVNRRLKLGERPGENIPWKTFCKEVRNKCDESEGGRSPQAKRGFSDKTIEREARAAKSKLGS